MSYTVLWKPAAKEELASLWLEGSDRPAVTAAANEIDRLLRTAPEEQGESRALSMRILFVRPLGVEYHIQDEDRIVSVLRVWRIQ